MKEKVVIFRKTQCSHSLCIRFSSPPLFSQQYSSRRLHCLGGTKVVCRLGHEIASEMAIS